MTWYSQYVETLGRFGAQQVVGGAGRDGHVVAPLLVAGRAKHDGLGRQTGFGKGVHSVARFDELFGGS